MTFPIAAPLRWCNMVLSWKCETAAHFQPILTGPLGGCLHPV